MISLTIALSDEVMYKLQAMAERHHTAPEALVRASFEALVDSPAESFEDTLAYVLHKNEELYQGLAK